MDLNVSKPCSDFYRYSCGTSIKLFKPMESQEVFLWNIIDVYDEIKTFFLDCDSQLSDTDRVRLIEQYRELCRVQTQSNGVELTKAIVKFLHTVPDGTSWWELESWAVSNRFNSTLFSVEIVHAHHEHAFITLLHPYTRSLQDNYINTSSKIVAKLRGTGLNPKTARRISDGILREQDLYSTSTITGPKDPTSGISEYNKEVFFSAEGQETITSSDITLFIMRLSVEPIKRSSIVLVLVLSFGIHCFGDGTGLLCSEWTDCFLRALKTGLTGDGTVYPCEDFYSYACGSNAGRYRLFDTYSSQEAHLREVFNNRIQTSNATDELNLSDTELGKLIKLYYQLCANETHLKEEGVKPIVAFLRTVPYDSSWWELEKWAVSKGFDSTLFSVDILNDYPYPGLIVLVHPDTRSLEDNYSNISRNMVTKLHAAGLDKTMADRLFDGITKEKEFYSKSTVDADHLWRNPDPGVPINVTEHDWEEYSEIYWNSVMNTDGIVPVLKNGRFKVVMSKSVKILEEILKSFTDHDMKNIIIWRMVTQLVHYASQETRDVLEELPTQSCLTPPMQSALRKNYWYRIIPTSVRRSIKKVYHEVDLQAKLLTYNNLTKVTANMEPLTPREQKHLKHLDDAHEKAKTSFHKLTRQLNSAKAELKKMEDSLERRRRGFPQSRVNSRKLHEEYRIKIPILKARIPGMESDLNAKSGEYRRSELSLNNFKTKNENRTSLDATVHGVKTRKLQDYIKDRWYPTFPFEDTITRFKSIIQPPAADANYVELGLSLKKWERSMLLQLPAKFEPHIEDENFIINGFTNDCFARFQNQRPTSVHYGFLGSALGYEISQGLREPVIDGITVTRLQTHLISNILNIGNDEFDARDWKDDFNIFIQSNLNELFIWGGVPTLQLTAEQFLKENPDPKIRDPNVLNATEWLLIAYKAVNTEIGLKAAWNAYRRDLKLNGENDERMACYKENKIFPRFNQDKLFFLSFGFNNYEENISNVRKTAFNTLLKDYQQFEDVFKDHPGCIASTEHTPQN